MESENGPSVSGIANLKEIHDKLSSSHEERTEDGYRAWNEACIQSINSTTNSEQLEELLPLMTIYHGLAAGTTRAEAFGELQKKLIAIYMENISNSTIDEVKQIADKMYRLQESGVHIRSGSEITQKPMLEVCARWYGLCQSKEDLVEMMKKTSNYFDLYRYLGLKK